MLRLMITLPILLTACLKDETASGYAGDAGVFVLQELNGQTFGARATIAFPRAGKVAGETPCNRYTAGQDVPYPWFQITDLSVTKKACRDQALETEYLDALQSATLIEAFGDTLILSNDEDLQMLFRAPQD